MSKRMFISTEHLVLFYVYSFVKSRVQSYMWFTRFKICVFILIGFRFHRSRSYHNICNLTLQSLCDSHWSLNHFSLLSIKTKTNIKTNRPNAILNETELVRILPWKGQSFINDLHFIWCIDRQWINDWMCHSISDDRSIRRKPSD